MNRLCTICARGGSKGVKGKNLRELNGKPLIAFSLLQAKKSELFDHIAVSSDSEEILAAAKQWGADILVRRPAELATDTAPKIPAIRHCVQAAETQTGKTFETLVDLDSTSPLRSVDDIRGAVKLMEETGVSNVITGTPARRSPYFNLVEETDKGSVRLAKALEKPIERRQDAPKCFDMNASIYVWTREVLMNSDKLFQPDTKIFVMPEERSLDIDSELDFTLVEFIAKTHGRFQDAW
jgi:CMP-N,N'-diacetyllegionaminic acid synthase